MSCLTTRPSAAGLVASISPGLAADIADMREGEGDDLPGIGRVGQRLLIAGHAGVEAQLAHPALADARRSPAAPKHGPVGQDERGGRAGRRCIGVRHGLLAPSGCRSAKDRPVAATMADQCLDGNARACRHFRTASAPDAGELRSSVRPTKRAITSSTDAMAQMYGKKLPIAKVRRWSYLR